MTTRVCLTVTPLKPAPNKPQWVWDVTAEENLSGKRHAVGRVTCDPAGASPRARELTARERPDFVVLATVVEPNPEEMGS